MKNIPVTTTALLVGETLIPEREMSLDSCQDRQMENKMKEISVKTSVKNECLILEKILKARKMTRH